MKLIYFFPFAVFMVVAGFLARGLMLDPSVLPSALIGKPAPVFRVAQLENQAVEFNSQDMAGQVWILNVWASWCTSCVVEHPLFVDLSEKGIVPIVGLNYKDNADEAKAWLQRFGNPYQVIAQDMMGKVGIDWGVVAVPETFVIDQQGQIAYKHTGPVDQSVIDGTILPLIEQLRRG